MDDGTATMIPATLTLQQLQALIPKPPRALTLEQIDETIRQHAVSRRENR